MEGEAVVFSASSEVNPAFAGYIKVYVPYCSSDEHSGNKEASEETGNFHFNGRNIVSAVVDDLHATGTLGHPGGEHVVLAGASAGGAATEHAEIEVRPDDALAETHRSLIQVAAESPATEHASARS